MNMNMKIKVNRFVYSYLSSPEVVEDYILRSDYSATKTYGKDLYFSRLSQVLDQARFLGWHLPRFGRDIPSEFTEIPLEGINHLFESQIKLLIDVVPSTLVTLVSEEEVPVKLICGATPAGDLVWRLILLSDESGNPYIRSSGKELPVKTSGTRIVCREESIDYSEQYLVDCFGGDSGGVWPMPFLPEFFLDKSIAYSFRPEDGVVEVVNIEETDPIKVIAVDRVPWYRNIEVDRTRALSTSQNPEDVSKLVSGWDELQDNDRFDYEEPEEDPMHEYPRKGTLDGLEHGSIYNPPYFTDNEDSSFDETPPWEEPYDELEEEEPFDLEEPVREGVAIPPPKEEPKAVVPPPPPPPPPPPLAPSEAAPVVKKEPEISFKIKVGRGRPRKAPTYEKAMSIVARNEKQGKKCEVYSSDSPEAVYITGIGELK